MNCFTQIRCIWIYIFLTFNLKRKGLMEQSVPDLNLIIWILVDTKILCILIQVSFYCYRIWFQCREKYYPIVYVLPYLTWKYWCLLTLQNWSWRPPSFLPTKMFIAPRPVRYLDQHHEFNNWKILSLSGNIGQCDHHFKKK